MNSIILSDEIAATVGEVVAIVLLSKLIGFILGFIIQSRIAAMHVGNLISIVLVLFGQLYLMYGLPEGALRPEAHLGGCLLASVIVLAMGVRKARKIRNMESNASIGTAV